VYFRTGLAIGDGDRFAVGGFLVGETELPRGELQVGEEVFDMNEADDVIEISVTDGEAGEGGFLNGSQEVADGLPDDEKIDMGARHHDLADLEIFEREGAGEQGAAELGDNALGDRLKQQGFELFLGMGEGSVGADAGGDAEPRGPRC
jgi:hypothetical protein